MNPIPSPSLANTELKETLTIPLVSVIPGAAMSYISDCLSALGITHEVLPPHRLKAGLGGFPYDEAVRRYLSLYAGHRCEYPIVTGISSKVEQAAMTRAALSVTEPPFDPAFVAYQKAVDEAEFDEASNVETCYRMIRRLEAAEAGESA